MTNDADHRPNGAPHVETDGDRGDDIEIDIEIDVVVVTMAFDAVDEAALLSALAKYVVLTRMVPGCRNVDLVASVTTPGRHLVVQKWDGFVEQQAHFDSPLMIEMAEACAGILAGPPDIDLWSSTSAHDLA